MEKELKTGYGDWNGREQGRTDTTERLAHDTQPYTLYVTD